MGMTGPNPHIPKDGILSGRMSIRLGLRCRRSTRISLLIAVGVFFFLLSSLIQGSTRASSKSFEGVPIRVQVADARKEAAAVLFDDGFKAWQAGKFIDAIENFEMGLELFSVSTRAHYYLAESLKEIGRRADALKHYETAAKINPDSKEGYLAAAKAKRLRKIGVRLEKMGMTGGKPDETICWLAIAVGEEGPAWDERSFSREYVNEAKYRHLTPQKCVALLGRKDTE